MQFTERQIKELIAKIESGEYDEFNLPVDYYNALTAYLKKAVFEGFGATLDSVSRMDIDLLEELVFNVHVFAAAKDFQQTLELRRLLVDDEGNVRSSREFNRLARETYDNWNDNWGRTEYNTAVGQADMAAKWRDIERNKDVMPNLEYSAVMDPNTSEICAPLDGIIAPVDDPIWDKITPLNHFNCRCLLLQTDQPATPDYQDRAGEVIKTIPDAFQNNPGKTGEIFTKDHPYFEVSNQYRDWAKENFGLELPKFTRNDETN